MRSLTASYRRWVYLLLTCFWGAMFVGTHLPKPPPSAGMLSDKVMHLLAFTGLGFLLSAAVAAQGKSPAQRFFRLLLILATYAAADELLQIPVGRDAELGDWLADITGAALGLTSFLVLRGVVHRIRGVTADVPEEVPEVP